MIDRSMDALVWLRKQLDTSDNDLLRAMVRSFAEELMSAEADVACNASYGEVSEDRVKVGHGVNRASALAVPTMRSVPAITTVNAGSISGIGSPTA